MKETARDNECATIEQGLSRDDSCSAIPRVVKCIGSRWNELTSHYEPHEYEMIVWSICGDYWLVCGVGPGNNPHPRVEHVSILRQTVLELQNVTDQMAASTKPRIENQ